MIGSRRQFAWCLLIAGVLYFAPAPRANSATSPDVELAKAGRALFGNSCAFCHGRDAAGGESGPDLTRSALVAADKAGEKISAVVREGRAATAMPAFDFSPLELERLTAFLHLQQAGTAPDKGDRRGVEVRDLQTGNAAAGKTFFNGAGSCATCHSASADLAGIATRYQGLELEQRMLFPQKIKSRVTVTPTVGESIAGSLEYMDGFTLGMRDSAGWYRSWKISKVKYVIDDPLAKHEALLHVYSDDDIHNLLAYLLTLK